FHDGKKLEVQFDTRNVMDEIRVITAPSPTSVTTRLSDGTRTAAMLSVGTRVPVTDSAVLAGVKKKAGGSITYGVYSDSVCTTLRFDATPAPNIVINGMVPLSKVFASDISGVFYWRARYSGDKHNPAAASVCADEQLTVAAPARLRLVKHVVNDNGGSASAESWTMTVTGTAPSPASFPGSEAGTLVTLNPGAYAVSENAAIEGYSPTLSAGCVGTLAAGEQKTCTISNDD